jgi:NAD(P)-dependent dehydrogenase (short-subunit alcohol dehydrogenase family)
MNVLIVGGSGTYGKALQEAARKLDLSVEIVSRGVEKKKGGYFCDLNKIADISQRINEVENLGSETLAIINSGVLGPVGLSSDVGGKETIEAFNINALSNIPLFQSLFLKGVRKFVIVSSGAAIKNYSGWFVYCQTKRLQKAIWESFCHDHNEISVRLVAPGVLASNMHNFTDDVARRDFPELDKFFELREHGGYQDENESAEKLFNLFTGGQFFKKGFQYLDLREC